MPEQAISPGIFYHITPSSHRFDIEDERVMVGGYAHLGLAVGCLALIAVSFYCKHFKKNILCGENVVDTFTVVLGKVEIVRWHRTHRRSARMCCQPCGLRYGHSL